MAYYIVRTKKAALSMHLNLLNLVNLLNLEIGAHLLNLSPLIHY